ncbi:MAG: SDR family NAD(P)-dependent oxidoreductase [Paenalcaligenes sp.]
MSGFCLVTGAGGGIGNAVVSRLAADGFKVLAADLSRDKAAQALAGVSGSGHEAVALDVSDEKAVDALFAKYDIDQVVAAAGVLLFAPNGDRPLITEMELADWELTQRVNSTGTFLLTRAFLRRANQHSIKNGRFVGFASVAAQLGGYRSSSAYIASKSAVLGFMKAAARESAHLGVTVNCVAPGLIDAPMLHQSLDPKDYHTVTGNIPLQRVGTPADVAGAVAFLMSDDAAYITGSVIDVNGGYRMQ